MAKCNDQSNSSFAVRHGVYCKLLGDYHTPIIPASALDLKKLIFLEVHASALGGHLGLYKMRKVLEKHFYWKNL